MFSINAKKNILSIYCHYNLRYKTANGSTGKNSIKY